MELLSKVKKLVDSIESTNYLKEDLKPTIIVGKISAFAQEVYSKDKDTDFFCK